VIEDIPSPELGFVQFRTQVVVIEDESGPVKHLEPCGHQEQEIRRIASMDYFETVTSLYPVGEPKLRPEGTSVFPQVADRAADFRRQIMPIDVNAFDLLIVDFISFSSRTNDSDVVPVPRERRCLHPDPTIERNRKIFNNDQNSA
jgi:hypothetical protein